MTELTRSELVAIEIALDELDAYVGTVGDADEAHARQKWAVKKLHGVVAREQRRLEPFAEPSAAPGPLAVVEARRGRTPEDRLRVWSALGGTEQNFPEALAEPFDDDGLTPIETERQA